MMLVRFDLGRIVAGYAVRLLTVTRTLPQADHVGYD
jgi:hypothetical protein